MCDLVITCWCSQRWEVVSLLVRVEIGVVIVRHCAGEGLSQTRKNDLYGDEEGEVGRVGRVGWEPNEREKGKAGLYGDSRFTVPPISETDSNHHSSCTKAIRHSLAAGQASPLSPIASNILVIQAPNISQTQAQPPLAHGYDGSCQRAIRAAKPFGKRTAYRQEPSTRQQAKPRCPLNT